jgi:hypothetical protein
LVPLLLAVVTGSVLVVVVELFVKKMMFYVFYVCDFDSVTLRSLEFERLLLLMMYLV